MARDCLHPVMLYSHVGTHSLQRALLFVYHLFQPTPSRRPTAPRRCKTGPWLRHRPGAETLCCCLFYTLTSIQMCGLL